MPRRVKLPEDFPSDETRRTCDENFHASGNRASAGTVGRVTPCAPQLTPAAGTTAHPTIYEMASSEAGPQTSQALKWQMADAQSSMLNESRPRNFIGY